MKDFVGRTALPELTMQRVILNLFFVICLPDFVTKVDFDWAIEEKAKKKKQDFTKVKFFTYDKGECVQCMHLGSYDDESETISAMIEYAEKQD